MVDSNNAALLTAVGEIDIVEWTIPEPRDDEVLVRVDAVGICGSDVHYYRRGRIGGYVVDAPLVLGHETAGTIVGVGGAVDASRVGDRVTIEPGLPCGRCNECRHGRYNLCSEMIFHGTPPIHGTMQEFVTVRTDFAYTLPDNVSTDEGALIEPLAVAVWACRKASVGPGTAVLVTGVGPVGLLVLQVAKAMGAAQVTVTDPSPDRRSRAISLGASVACEPSALAEHSHRTTYDAHIECSGNISATRDAMRWIAPAGTVVLVGMGSDDELGIDTSLVQERELVITGTFRYANCYPAALDLLASGRVRVAELITGRFPIAHAAAALESLGRPGSLKLLIMPQLHTSDESSLIATSEQTP